ncbi:methyltransferase domain-containing protein [Streptomyces cinnabarinus]|uniref:Methyltransferase domain-containing protein n=1 Tax=Streptomyces cinnabarinus TaxID=67287 RepID=A0ABY7KKJ4_9ACTN|nr:class I SAM-dependent methyltransferase [Streptomyces cinnabarinus]WAZ24834.1 methyltransferase domain-containing protein [Streptomyces cinnabarinus]
MSEQRRFDVWQAGPGYERYMGRWSRKVAERFTALEGHADGLRWLDVGCGTGALSAVLTARCRPAVVLGCDRSAELVATARVTAHGPVGFAVADARALPVRDGSWDMAVSGLALNFLPEPAEGVAEMARAVRPGGRVAAYVWDYAEGMELLRRFWDAAAAVDPAAAELDEGRRFPMCRPDPLYALWTGAGLEEVRITPVVVPTVFTDLTDLWAPFLAGQGPAAGYVTGLPPEDRDRLRTALAESLPAEPDGTIALAARAWTVRGTKP